jgi:hypothetical protein
LSGWPDRRRRSWKQWVESTSPLIAILITARGIDTQTQARFPGTRKGITTVAGNRPGVDVGAGHMAHLLPNVGSDRDQLSSMAKQAREALASDTLSVLADRGYFRNEQILACQDV